MGFPEAILIDGSLFAKSSTELASYAYILAYVTVAISTVILVVALHWRTAVGCTTTNVPLLPGGQPLIGHATDMLHNQHRFHEWIADNSTTMGYKTFCFTIPLLPSWFVVSDPTCLEYILRTEMHNYIKGYGNYINFKPILGHGIFSSDGDDWLWQRKLATNIFTVKSFKRYIDMVFSQEMDIFTNILTDAGKSGAPIDLHDMMYRFTLDSFGHIGFGTSIHSLTSKGKVPFAAAFDLAQVLCAERFLTPGWKLTELFNGRRKALNRCTHVMRSFAMEMISQRRQQQAGAGKATHHAPAGAADADGDTTARDLLSLFMEAKGPSGQPLTDDQLIDTVLNFIIAGRDTTAQALSWTFYELMQHPDVEAKLVQELQDVLGSDIAHSDAAVKPTYDQIRALRYTRACFLEALRLHPSVPENVKNVVATDTLPDGSIIPKGARILFSAYTVNRMPAFWGPDAQEFRPERWLDMSAMPSPYSYISFNAGPRLCLGQRLAEIEGVYVLAGLLSKFRFTQVETGSEVKYLFSVSMPMNGGLQVVVLPRT